jgi:hypothetical protein
LEGCDIELTIARRIDALRRSALVKGVDDLGLIAECAPRTPISRRRSGPPGLAVVFARESGRRKAIVGPRRGCMLECEV